MQGGQSYSMYSAVSVAALGPRAFATIPNDMSMPAEIPPLETTKPLSIIFVSSTTVMSLPSARNSAYAPR